MTRCPSISETTLFLCGFYTFCGKPLVSLTGLFSVVVHYRPESSEIQKTLIFVPVNSFFA